MERERISSAKSRVQEGLPPYEFPASYLETLAVYRQMSGLLLADQTILFHGSALAVDGQCYLFTAKSGTGKSTHTRLWRKLLGDKVIMVNDDKPLIRLTDTQAILYGTPWDGKHHLSTNTSMPLKAICWLTRSEKNYIEEVSPADIFPVLLQQTHQPTGHLQEVFALLSMLSQCVRFYKLGCNMDLEAARVAYEGMKG